MELSQADSGILAVVEKATKLVGKRISKRISHLQLQLDAKEKIRERQLLKKREIHRRQVEWRKTRIQKRRPQALAGVQRILAFSKSGEIQRLIKSLSKLPSMYGSAKVNFYFANRPSGDAFYTKGEVGSGTREVCIELTKTGFTLFAGSYSNSEGYRIEFGFQNTNEEILSELEELVSPYHINIFSVLEQKNQFSLEWDPYDLAFQVLVSCSRRTVFEKVILIAMKELEESELL